jgi:adenosylhomocysteinase
VAPLRALEAAMNGFTVMPIDKAASIGDIFITTTGNINVIQRKHMEKMKDGAILANSGHFNVEINIAELEAMAETKREAKANVKEYLLKDGRRLYLLAEGRLVNLAAAEGHPPEVMDMSFANQALSAEYLVKAEKMPPRVRSVPKKIDKKIAKLKLNTMNIEIDELTDEQKEYLAEWSAGTI